MAWDVPGGAMASPVLERLEEIHRRHISTDGGAVATYIPELAHADRRWFGICLATADGHIYEVGDTRQPFTIQSISKPFTYGAALAAHGRAGTLTKVGVEPSGDAFNAISLDPVTGRPANPMINAGAIAACGLLAGDTPEAKLAGLLETYGMFAGRPLSIDEKVFLSERETGFRNRAIGYLLRNAGILTEDPDPILDLYFRQCSVLVDCRDLAVMAATLAAGGVNPLTGSRALDGESVESVLSMIGSCGMYDFAGEWACSVGLPAKSGVSGGILAVLPGQLGIGIFSPPLDPRGNSVRGIAVCKELSQSLGLHLFAAPQSAPRASREVIHRSYSAADVPSKRERLPEVRRMLGEVAGAARVYELQGVLAFGTAEVVVRDVSARASTDAEIIVLDLSRVVHMNATAVDLLSLLALRLAERGKRLLFAHRKPEFTALLQECLRVESAAAHAAVRRDDLDALTFPDTDRAVEWCEEYLLARYSVGPLRLEGKEESVAAAETLKAFALLHGLDAADLSTARNLLRRVHYRAGDKVVQAGDPADCLFLVARGEVTVMLPLLSGHEKRLATFTAGMSFGEMAFVEGSTRSATIYADRDTECWTLHREDLDRLAQTHPHIKAALMENIALDLCQRLRATNATLSALAQ
jgi:glutaminase